MFGKGLFVLEPVGDPLMTLRNDTDTLYSYNVRFSWLPGCRSQGEAQMRGKFQSIVENETPSY